MLASAHSLIPLLCGRENTYNKIKRHDVIGREGVEIFTSTFSLFRRGNGASEAG